MQIQSRAQYWDDVAREWAAAGRQKLWRRYSDELHRAFVTRWLPDAPFTRVLKTDAFDEATSDLGLRVATAGVAISLDVSVTTLREARRRHTGLVPLAGNVRQLPIRNGVFDVIVSTSTLDHMDDLEDIAVALGELHRVMRAGGRLILTLDNRLNPAVALRSWLPQRWLQRLHVVPYHVGANCGPRHLRKMVAAAGFDAQYVGSLMHTPRFPSVIICNVCDWMGLNGLGRALVRGMMSLEALDRLPARFLTGYFVSVVATRT